MAGLEDLYREIILDHYRSPRNRGELPDTACAHGSRGSTPCAATRWSSTCRSRTAPSHDIRFAGQGCSISQSSASLMSAAVKGKTGGRGPRPDPHVQGDDVDPRGTSGRRADGTAAANGSGDEGPDAVVADPESLGELAALQGVVKFPVRIKCATLSWNTLAQGLDDAEEGTPANR